MALTKELEVGIVTTAQLLLQQPVHGPALEATSFRPKIKLSSSSSSSSSSSEKKASSSSSTSKTKKKTTTAH
jgi:hypothetical protein